jgi:PAS domain S-box-containing protein
MEKDAVRREDILQKIAATDLQIQEREAAHKQLRESEERYRNFIDNIDESCYEVDLRGIFTFVNNRLAQRLNMSKEAILGRPMNFRLVPEDKEKVQRIYNECFRTGTPVKNLIYRYRPDADSEEIRLSENTGYLIRNADGKPVGFRSITRDVTDRERHIQELQRYKDFVENAGEACFEVDLTGRYVSFNDALCRLADRSREEMLQADSREFLTPEMSEKLFKMYNHIYRTGEPAPRLAYDIITKTGQIRHVEASVSLMRDEEGKPIGFRGISRDVTEKKKKQAQLARYKNFVENVHDACIENDLTGHLTFLNESFCRMTGYDRQDVDHLDWRATVVPEDLKAVEGAYEKARKLGETIHGLIYRLLRKDGVSRVIEVTVQAIQDRDGKPVGFRSISRDVTDREKRKEDLERYHDFIENVEDSIFEMDLEGRVTFFNEAMCRNTEYSADELLHFNRRKWYVSEDHAKKSTKTYLNIVRTGVTLKGYQGMVRTKSGKILHSDLTISLIRDAAGHPIGFRCISRDVTERKHLEEAQGQLAIRLAQAEKLESIGTLAGGIAHDFNNLLMGIQGYVSLILMDKESHDPHYPMLKAMEDQVKSGADLTRQLLGYARGGRYVITATDLNDLIGKTISVFARTKKEIQVHERYTPDLWTVQVDQGQIGQVLLNLFINAWQAMPGGGSLHLETSNVFLDDDDVKAFDGLSGPYVKISVTDTGMGMDQKTRQRIFEPFFTTKEMGRGAGLGLASAYGIIRGHRGLITVYSELGRGTTFNIYLPADNAETVKTATPLTAESPPQGIILIVDDEKAVRDVTGSLLERRGYEVMCAQSGEEALALYRDKQEMIALVIMDMIMPEMGGGEAIDRLREINPDIKVILSSGYSLNDEAKHILEKGGARDFIQKPFQVDELVKKMEALRKEA